MILGLYMLLWGKDKDQEQHVSSSEEGKEQEPPHGHDEVDLHYSVSLREAGGRGRP